MPLRKSSLALSLVLSLALGSEALAQSGCSNIVTGAVLTAGQWNQCFAAKQNVLGYTPLNIAGGVMTGKLVTTASQSGFAGLQLPHGIAPSSPINGDMWTTTAGLFVRINGVTFSFSSSANVAGPASATDNAIARFDGTTGKVIQNSIPTISDNGTVTINPTASTINKALSITQTTQNTGGLTAGELDLNEIIASNGVQRGPSGSTMLPFADNVVSGLKITFNEQTNAGGFQIPLLVRLNHTVPTMIWGAADNNYSDHIGIAVQVYSSAADTSATGNGAGVYGMNPAVWFGAGAVHSNMVSVNADLNIDAAAVVQYAAGIRLQRQGLGSATLGDSAITTFTNSGVGWTNFVTFNETFNAQSIKTTGNIFTAEFAFTVANFANLANMTVTGDILNFPHAVLTGSGSLTLNRSSTATASLPTLTNNIMLRSFAGANTAGIFQNFTYGSGAASVPIFVGSRSRGTAPDARTATQSGDALVTFSGAGYGTSADSSTTGGMSAFAEENFTNTANGTNVTIFTTPIGSTAATTRMRVSAAGVLDLSQNTTAIASLPASESGTIFHVTGADGAVTRATLDAFGTTASGTLNFRHARGTAASPTATQSGDTIGSTFAKGRGNAGAYLVNAGSGFVMIATENYTTNGGARLDFYSTSNGANVTTARGSVEDDGGLTWPRAVTGGSKGAGTINAQGYYLNGALLMAPGIAEFKTTVDFNTTNTDYPIAITLPAGYSRWMVNTVFVSGCSASITTATAGLFTAAAGGGTALVAGASALTVSSSAENTNANAQTHTVLATSGTQSFNATTIYYRVANPQGSAATCTVTVQLRPVS